MDYQKVFNQLKPKFFQMEVIRNMPEDRVFTELIMDLKKQNCTDIVLKYPEHIRFDFYKGDLKTLKEAVARVDNDWVPLFTSDQRFFCAFDGDKIAAFCCLEKIGIADGLLVGGPGCVGTLPEYRKQGIGLEMVRRATEILRKEDFDISWIHWTHLADWYSKLGYQLVLKWNKKGFIAF